MAGLTHALPPEPWGRQLTRAREDVAGLTMEQAVAKIGRYMLTSTGTLSRLESLEDAPTGASRRQLACIAVIVYGIDPERFGLGRDDLPPAIYAALRRDGRLRVSNRQDDLGVTRRYTPTEQIAA